MRVSFSSGTFYHRALRYSLELARDAGYDGVEAVLGPGYLARGVEPWRQAIQQTSVPIFSVHPPFFPLPGWPRRFTQTIPRVATVARELDASLAVVHTPFLAHEHSPRAERYTEGLRLGRRAGGGEVEIALESNQYNKRSQRYYLDDLGNLARFAQERGCYVTFDTCHAGANGQDLLECYAIVKPVMRNVHLSDVAWHGGVARTHRLPGTGSLPLPAFLAALVRDGYDGLITLEIHPSQMGLIGRQRHIRRLRQALTFVRGALAVGDGAPRPAHEAQAGT
jgi:sugar phosphate isomerase/epimerase